MMYTTTEEVDRLNRPGGSRIGGLAMATSERVRAAYLLLERAVNDTELAKILACTAPDVCSHAADRARAAGHIRALQNVANYLGVLK